MFALVLKPKGKKPGASPFARGLFKGSKPKDGPSGDGGESTEDEAGDDSVDPGARAGVEAAQRLIDAVKAGNADDVWSAYQGMCMAHERSGAEEAEEESDEESEDEGGEEY